MVRKTPDDDFDQKLLDDVENHGWHLVAIGDDSEGPAYVFSVGLYHTLGHPEICIFGLSSTDTMGRIINGIGSLIRSGESFEDWFESEDILEGYSCMFRCVDRSLYPEDFGYCRWFYEGDDFPMLQCVWPDKNQNYPWDSGFNSALVESQPVLATKTPWPFVEARTTGVFSTRQVIEEGLPILLVIHDEDGDWQFLCGTTSATDDCRLVCLLDIVESHPSVSELADLPMGWRAFREALDQPWQRMES